MALSVAEIRKQMNETMGKVAKKMRAKMKIQEMMDDAELSEVDDAMVESMLQLMGSDFSSDSWIDFWVTENCVFDTYFVCQDWYSGKMFMMDYSTENDIVTCSNPRLAKIEYVEVAEKILAEMSERIAEVYKQNRELSADLEQKDTEINELKVQKETEVETLQKEISQLKEVKTEVEQKDEVLLKLNEQLNSLKDEIAGFIPIKAEYDAIQEEKRIAELNQQKEDLKKFALSTKLIDEKELIENEEIKNAIEELNTQKIKDIALERLVNKTSTETSSKDNDVTLTIDVNGKDLIPQSGKDRMYAPAKRD